MRLRNIFQYFELEQPPTHPLSREWGTARTKNACVGRSETISTHKVSCPPPQGTDHVVIFACLNAMARLLLSQKFLSQHSRIAHTLCRRASSFFQNDYTPPKLGHVTSDWNELYKQSIQDPVTFWGQLGASRLQWMQNFDVVMDCDMNEGRHKWFLGGKLNVSGDLGATTFCRLTDISPFLFSHRCCLFIYCFGGECKVFTPSLQSGATILQGTQ